MAFAAGERITAARLNRLQPTTYYAQSSSNLTGPQTGVDVPGMSVTFDTTAANAIYTAHIVMDFDLTGATTTAASARLIVDGIQSGLYPILQQGVSTDRATVGQGYRGTLAAAGSHTLKVQATIPTSMNTSPYSTLVVTVYEVA